MVCSLVLPLQYDSKKKAILELCTLLLHFTGKSGFINNMFFQMNNTRLLLYRLQKYS